MGLNEREINLIERTFLVMGTFLAIVFSALCLAVLIWPDLASAADVNQHAYAGPAACKKCHKLQFESWSKTKHATAKSTASKLPKDLKVDPEVVEVTESEVRFLKTGETQKCLECHTTGFDPKTGKSVHDGVSCESCHGAGADYGKVMIMKNREKAVAAGLTIPTESTCRKCHRDDNPFEKEKFDFSKRKVKVHEHKKKEGAK